MATLYTPDDNTNPLRTGPANPCGTSACYPNIATKCYNPYSSSQSFFLRMKKQTRDARDCANYSPDCANGGCSSVNDGSCSMRTGKQRITAYRQPGARSSPYRGGGSAKELMRRVKHRAPVTVRGRQTSQSTLIRAARSVQRLPVSTVGRPNTYGTGVMLARTQQRPVAWNPPHTKACCTDTEAYPQTPSETINEVRGDPQNVIGPGNTCKGPCTCGACGTCG